MAALASPRLRLQKKLTNRPYGGGWWPDGHGVSRELLELVQLWPADRSPIRRYAFIRDDWDKSESSVPTHYRTRTLVLVLTDGSSCRLLVLPPDTPADVAEELLAEASNPLSSWHRVDFVSTQRLVPGTPATSATASSIK